MKIQDFTQKENSAQKSLSASNQGDKYNGSASFIEDSQVDDQLDIIPISPNLTLDFSQENLSKRIPNFILLNLIANHFPDMVTDTNEITFESLIEIIRNGAKLNCLECLSEEIINDLALSLVGYN